MLCRWPSQAISRLHAFSIHKPTSSSILRQFQQKFSLTAHVQNDPLRKHLKDELKQRKKQKKALQASGQHGYLAPDAKKWKLTVGIEVHAELNTARKLFSDARTAPLHFSHSAPSPSDSLSVSSAPKSRETALYSDHDSSSPAEPNSHVAPFDAALPGTQPRFQIATLIPAIRAALALKCNVNRKSYWDRKHYFYQDQPNGYQITQNQSPLAVGGELILTLDDGIDPSDLDADMASHDKPNVVKVGIKQVQMEQDTAKTTVQGTRHLLDLNRVSHPLVEIITLPTIHSPKTAAAVVRKIQSLLRAVDACVSGMESGGLRADVNVSVTRGDSRGNGKYAGIDGLGTRTEIKNLGSLKAVEDAVAAEYRRQVGVLESGGEIVSETRGWALGSSETTLLRTKEGEVDYRYMPDPDLGAVIVGDDLLKHLKDTLPELPDATIARAVNDFGISVTDARVLYSQDDGARLDFLAEVVSLMRCVDTTHASCRTHGKLASNWILHELGGMMAADNSIWSHLKVTAQQMADLLSALSQKQITAQTAKTLLRRLYSGKVADMTVPEIIIKESLQVRHLDEDEYSTLAQSILDEHVEMVQSLKATGDRRKSMFFVGQMMRRGEAGTVDPVKAREVVESLLGF